MAHTISSCVKEFHTIILLFQSSTSTDCLRCYNPKYIAYSPLTCATYLSIQCYWGRKQWSLEQSWKRVRMFYVNLLGKWFPLAIKKFKRMQLSLEQHYWSELELVAFTLLPILIEPVDVVTIQLQSCAFHQTKEGLPTNYLRLPRAESCQHARGSGNRLVRGPVNLVGAREFHVAACLTSEVRVRVVLKEEDVRIEMSSYGSFSFIFSCSWYCVRRYHLPTFRQDVLCTAPSAHHEAVSMSNSGFRKCFHLLRNDNQRSTIHCIFLFDRITGRFHSSRAKNGSLERLLCAQLSFWEISSSTR